MSKLFLRLAVGWMTTLLAGPGSVRAQMPSWARPLGYAESALLDVTIGAFGYPYIRVLVNDDTLSLAFDTGNMVGVSVSTATFDRLGLSSLEMVTRRSSSGQHMGSWRSGVARHLMLFGRVATDRRIFEMEEGAISGLVGPRELTGGHFTIDYPAGVIAVGDGPLPESLPGFVAVPMVRSSRHPALILVRGSVHGMQVVMELDTGKSRSVIDPSLAEELGLASTPNGVRIDRLELGGRLFTVPSAKEVSQHGIDPDLSDPIRLGIGSDILHDFVWSVDYVSATVWVARAH